MVAGDVTVIAGVRLQTRSNRLDSTGWCDLSADALAIDNRPAGSRTCTLFDTATRLCHVPIPSVLRELSHCVCRRCDRTLVSIVRPVKGRRHRSSLFRTADHPTGDRSSDPASVLDRGPKTFPCPGTVLPL